MKWILAPTLQGKSRGWVSMLLRDALCALRTAPSALRPAHCLTEEVA